MNTFSYVTVKQQIGEGSEARTCYGIAAAVANDGCVQLMKSYDDLSDDIEPIRQFVEACNELHVEIVHFADVVEDFLAVMYGV